MKRLIAWSTASFVLMLGGPWLALRLGGMDAMGVCFLLFFAVNPAFAIGCGVFAGRQIRQLWVLPIITAVAFIAGVWLLFETGEPAFLIYAGCYFALGVVAMLISAWIKRIRKRKATG